MQTDADNQRSRQSGVFEWARGVGAEVFGVAGEAESGLFDGVGGETFECAGIRT